MENNRKKRFTKITFLLNGFLLLFGGVELISDQQLLFGLLQWGAGVLNLGMLFNYKKERIKTRLEVGILVMNIIVAVSVAVNYQLAGASYIQYAWVVAAVMSSVALVVHLRKRRKLT